MGYVTLEYRTIAMEDTLDFVISQWDDEWSLTMFVTDYYIPYDSSIRYASKKAAIRDALKTAKAFNKKPDIEFTS